MELNSVNEYLISVRCTNYTLYNVPSPVKTGSFVFDITEEFSGNELQAWRYYKSKYNKHLVSRFSITDFEVIYIYKKIQEGGSK